MSNDEKVRELVLNLIQRSVDESYVIDDEGSDIMKSDKERLATEFMIDLEELQQSFISNGNRVKL